MLNLILFNFSPLEILFFVFAVLIAIGVHEFGHAGAAFLYGDNTAARTGRLTPNPFKHLDTLGTIAFVVLGIGWSKPVPVNTQGMVHPLRKDVYISLAGPGMNLATALIFFGIWQLGIVPAVLAFFVQTVIGINLTLMAFNLLPFFPLDGSHVVFSLLWGEKSRIALQFLHYSAPALLTLIALDYFFQIGLLWGIITPIRDTVLFLFHLIL